MDDYSTHWSGKLKRRGITAHDFTRSTDPNVRDSYGPNDDSYGRHNLYRGDYNARWAEAVTLGSRLTEGVRATPGEHGDNSNAWKSGMIFNHQYIAKKDVMPWAPPQRMSESEAPAPKQKRAASPRRLEILAKARAVAAEEARRNRELKQREKAAEAEHKRVLYDQKLKEIERKEQLAKQASAPSSSDSEEDEPPKTKTKLKRMAAKAKAKQYSESDSDSSEEPIPTERNRIKRVKPKKSKKQ
ncbi:MAG: hypothetical protein Q9217_007096, partial [Psora testacea]